MLEISHSYKHCTFTLVYEREFFELVDILVVSNAKFTGLFLKKLLYIQLAFLFCERTAFFSCKDIVFSRRVCTSSQADPGRSLLFTYFAARSGNPSSQLALAYHWTRHGECDKALPLYFEAAKTAMAFLSVPGRATLVEEVPLMLEDMSDASPEALMGHRGEADEAIQVRVQCWGERRRRVEVDQGDVHQSDSTSGSAWHGKSAVHMLIGKTFAKYVRCVPHPRNDWSEWR